MPVTRPAACRRSAFTMIEILVVVGIIAVLLSLIFTMTGRVKARSQMINCQANLRALYMASLQYSNDYDGFLLCGSLIGETSTSTNGKAVCWAVDVTGQANFQVGTAWPYMPQSQEERVRSVLCPSDTGEMARVGATQYPGRNFSYSFNANIRTSGSPITTLKLSQVIQPAKRVMIYEEFGPNDGSCFGPGDGDDWLTGRHGGENSIVSETRGNYNEAKWREIGAGNVAFFDGRVELMTVAHYFYDQTHYGPLTQ